MLVTASCSGTLETIRTRETPPGLSCRDAVGTVEPLRRLSHDEYWATLAAIGRVFNVPAPTQEFARDETSRGLINQSLNLRVSSALLDQYFDVARAMANRVTVSLRMHQEIRSGFAGCRETDLACGERVAERFAALAFRHRLQDAQKNEVLENFRTLFARHGFYPSIELTVQSALLAPDFLYHVELGSSELRDGVVALSPDELANRLSFALWGEPPDDRLRARAADNSLLDAATFEREARRLLGTRERAEPHFVAWHQQWLGLERLGSVNKDPEPYRVWNESLRAAISDEFRRFIGYVYFEGDGRLATLLTSRTSYVNNEIAPLYGLNAQDWTRVQLAPERTGVFTRLGFLAANGHPVEGSPVLRGVAILDRILCQPLTLPANTSLDLPPLNETVRTNRERYAAHTDNPACQSCHERIDGLGFPFELFDSIGRVRTTDHDRPIDHSGWIAAHDDQARSEIAGVPELMQRLVADPRVTSCVVRETFRFVRGRDADTSAADQCTVATLEESMQRYNGDLREVLIDLVLSPSFRERRIR